ncbi:MAG: ribosomal L7Ae/L30e/S12e/Gadd45 family protein [Clostridiales bacterium]|nr:ribosomal L7Ae/L30e/S12e/Gadd45 family protein [Clostridiales bacterium]
MITEAEKTRLQVGYKQAVRALGEDRVLKVFLADDCERKISAPIEELASQKDVQVFYIPTMKELGAMCGIEVGASCAVVLRG